MVITGARHSLGLDLNPQCRISNCNTWLAYLSQEQWYSNHRCPISEGLKNVFVWSSTTQIDPDLSCPSPVQPHSVLKGTETLNRNAWRKVPLATIVVPLLLFFSFDCSLPATVRAWLCSTLEMAATGKARRCCPSYTHPGCDTPLCAEHFPTCKQTSLDWQLWHLWIKD